MPSIARPGTAYRHVYVPRGTWVQYWTGERVQGPAHVLAHAPLGQPAIYVDTTQLSSSRVYLWTLDSQGELIAPMKMNVDTPKNCRAMAPRRWGIRGEWSYVLLCNEGQGAWSLKTLPIE